MSWKRVSGITRTVRFRITCVHIIVLSVISAAVFAGVYIALDKMLLSRLDAELVAEAEEWDLIHRSAGIPGMRIEFESEASALGGKQVYCAMFDAAQDRILATDATAWKHLPPPPRAFLTNGSPGGRGACLETVRLPDRAHAVRTAYYKDSAGNVFLFARSTKEADAFMGRFKSLAIMGALALIALGSAAVFIVTRRALRGLGSVTDTVRQVASGDLSRRVPVLGDGTEVDELGRAFNQMQARNESLVAHLKEVSMNVAHDLRSPLTRIRGVAEMAVTSAGSRPDLCDALGIVVEESDRLVGMIDTMLAIAEVESGAIDLTSNEADIAEVIRTGLDLFRPQAEAKGITLQDDLGDRNIVVRGDERRLQRVVANLLDNAIKYTPHGGKVEVRLASDAAGASLEVVDTGNGIRADDIDRVLDPFYRGDTSRSTDGHGLGLSYVASIVKAHGGEVRLQSEVGRYTVATVTLPRKARAPAPAVAHGGTS